MERVNLSSYIKDDLGIPEDLHDAIWTELNPTYTYFGAQFKSPRERGRAESLKFRIRFEIKRILKRIIKTQVIRPVGGGGRVISSAYFSVNREIEKLGYGVYLPPWVAGFEKRIEGADFRRRLENIQSNFALNSFRVLVEESFLCELQSFRTVLCDFYAKADFKTLVLPNDMYFFENISIRAFREMGRPSFVFLHGLPGRYNGIDDSRADFLVVWGDRIRQHYIDKGVPAEKVLVSGHPNLRITAPRNQRFSLESILVLTKSMPGAPPSTNSVILHDRGNMIVYLYSVQQVLRKLGVRQVVLRPHPSENSAWYQNYLDPFFFRIDRQPLNKSLADTSLVIGPTSTVMLEALCAGVNYCVYEPSQDAIDLLNMELVPPFDGSDARLPVARTEEELFRILKERIGVDTSFLPEYIRPSFDLGFLKRICG